MLANLYPDTLAHSKVLGAPAAELTFRIQGGEHDGRVVRTSGERCTIGSAPGCTLRLRRSDIEPLHCLILAGRQGTVIRRNSPRTYLNGGAFQDEFLKSGDVLRVGSLELVLVACPTARAASTGIVEPKPDDVVSDSKQSELNTQQALEIARLSRELTEQGALLDAARGDAHLQLQAGAEREDLLRQKLQQAEDSLQLAERSLKGELASLSEQLLAARQDAEEHRAASLQREDNLRAELLAAQAWGREEQILAAARVIDLEQAAKASQSTAEQLAMVQSELEAARQQLAARESQLQSERQSETEEFANERLRFEGEIAALTLRIQSSEQEAERGSQTGLHLSAELDNARRELQETKQKLNERESSQVEALSQSEHRLSELGERLAQREKTLAGRDHELAELKQRLEHYSAEDQMLRQLEQRLAAAESTHQIQRESWLRERQEIADKCTSAETAASDLRVELAQALAQQAPPAALAVDDEALSREREEKIERWQTEATKWQRQAEEVAGQLAEFKSSCSRLREEINDLRAAREQHPPEPVPVPPDPPVNAAELEGQRINSEEARGQLLEEESRLQRMRVELAQREEELARSESQLREQQTVWETVRAEQTAALDERSQLVNTQIAQFEAEQAAFARQQATMILQMSALEEKVQQLSVSKAPKAALPAPKISEFDVEESTAPGADQTSSIIRQLEVADAREEQKGTRNHQNESPEEAIANRTYQGHEAGAEHHEDETVAQYMSRLMNRVRGAEPAAPASIDATREPPEQSGEAPLACLEGTQEMEEEGAPAEYLPRAVAPEHPETFMQMREVANGAANEALHAHALKNRGRKTKHKSLVAILSFIGAGGLFAVGNSSGSLLALSGAAAFAVICAVMTLRAIIGGISHFRLRRTGY